MVLKVERFWNHTDLFGSNVPHGGVNLYGVKGGGKVRTGKNP